MLARCLITMLVLIAAAPAAAQAATTTAKNDIGDATNLTGSGPHTITYDTDGADYETGELNAINEDYERSVWVRWTPNVSGGAKIKSCGADRPFSDEFRIYKKKAGSVSVTNLQMATYTPYGEVPDWDCESVLKAVAGQTYFIVIVHSQYVPTDTGGTMTIVQDATGPALSFVNPPAQTGAKPVINYSAADANDFECKLDGTETDGCGFGSFSKAVKSGTHTLLVRARDSYYNLGGWKSHTFTVDADAPDTIIDSPIPTYGQQTHAFAFHASEAGVTFRCKTQAIAETTCKSPWTPPVGVTKGKHTITITAYDKWGNADPTPAIQSYELVYQPPPPPAKPTPVAVSQTPATPTHVADPPPSQPLQQPVAPTPPSAALVAQTACKPTVKSGKRTKRGLKVHVIGDPARPCIVTIVLKSGRRQVARVVRPVGAGAIVTVTVKPRIKARKLKLVSSAA